jgi:hypothetical protein
LALAELGQRRVESPEQQTERVRRRLAVADEQQHAGARYGTRRCDASNRRAIHGR